MTKQLFLIATALFIAVISGGCTVGKEAAVQDETQLQSSGEASSAQNEAFSHLSSKEAAVRFELSQIPQRPEEQVRYLSQKAKAMEDETSPEFQEIWPTKKTVQLPGREQPINLYFEKQSNYIYIFPRSDRFSAARFGRDDEIYISGENKIYLYREKSGTAEILIEENLRLDGVSPDGLYLMLHNYSSETDKTWVYNTKTREKYQLSDKALYIKWWDSNTSFCYYTSERENKEDYMRYSRRYVYHFYQVDIVTKKEVPLIAASGDGIANNKYLVSYGRGKIHLTEIETGKTKDISLNVPYELSGFQFNSTESRFSVCSVVRNQYYDDVKQIYVGESKSGKTYRLKGDYTKSPYVPQYARFSEDGKQIVVFLEAQDVDVEPQEYSEFTDVFEEVA